MLPLPKILLLTAFTAVLSSCQFKPYTGNDQFNPTASIPLDEAPHHKNSLEWWYFTGHLQDQETGQEFGLEYVFFHFNPLNKKDYMMVNFAISDPASGEFTYDYEIKRLPEILESDLPLNLNLDYKKENWKLTGQEGRYQLQANMVKQPGMSIDIRTEPTKPILLHDGTGYENYGDYAQAGYYSYPRLKAEGTMEVGGKERPVEGELWYDRQWNCIGVIEKKVSWDWISVQFNEIDAELMVYLIHHKESGERITGGSFFSQSNENLSLENGEVILEELEHWTGPKSKSKYPTHWRVTVPSLDLDVTVKALMPDQELSLNLPLTFRRLHYWEGKCAAKGSIGGQAVTGNSYVEITNRNI